MATSRNRFPKILLVTLAVIELAMSTCTRQRLPYKNEEYELVCSVRDPYGPSTQISDESGYKVFLDFLHSMPGDSIKIENLSGGTLVANFFPQNKNISQIFLNNTSLVTIIPGAFNGCDRLKRLYLQDNKIEKITEGMFNSLIGLVELYLQHNVISSVDPDSFVAMESLVVLQLDHNKITTLGSNTFTTLSNLKVLDVSDNPLGNIKDLHLRVTVLHLSGCNLTDVGSAYQTGKSVKNLSIKIETNDIVRMDLSHNSLKVFDVLAQSGMENFKYLNLSHNQIDQFKTPSSSSDSQLEVLDLSSNNLNKVSQRFCFAHLKYLNLSHNIIDHIKVGVFSCNLNNLTDLDLQHNQIRSVENGVFSDLSSLKHLDLSENIIETLPLGIFDNLNALKDLDLSSNRIQDVSFLLGIESITFLNLDNNRLTSLNTDYVKPLWTVSLDKNHWSCTCLIEMVLKLNSRRARITNGASYNVSNIRGISCNNSIAMPCESSGTKPIDFMSRFSEQFNHSAFVQFFNKTYADTALFRYLRRLDESLANSTKTDETRFYMKNVTVTLRKIEKLLTNSSKNSHDEAHPQNMPYDHTSTYLISIPLYVMMFVLIILLGFKIMEKKKRGYHVTKIENHDAAGLL